MCGAAATASAPQVGAAATGALATLAFSGPGWAALDYGTAQLTEFVRPRDLDR